VPELPEVEAARRSLLRTVAGKTIARVIVGRPTVLRTHSGPGFARALRGRTIRGITRQGKALRFSVDPWVLVFHYMLWGVVRFQRDGAAPGPGTGVFFGFAGGATLEFRELQLSTFHLLKTTRAAEAAEPGLDPLGRRLTFEAFLAALGGRGSLKDALCNQARIAGIGNLWAHEILFRARLRPDRTVQSLSPSEARRLYRTIRRTLRAAVAAGGEPGFHDALGREGRARLAVYGRAGERCRGCGGTVRDGRFHGRPTFFCPRCQR
jgi:formamidopyrimidine-DNA glycosylase